MGLVKQVPDCLLVLPTRVPYELFFVLQLVSLPCILEIQQLLTIIVLVIIIIIISFPSSVVAQTPAKLGWVLFSISRDATHPANQKSKKSTWTSWLLFMTCSRLLHDLFITCFMTCSLLFYNLFLTCSLLVYNLFMTCSLFAYDLSMTCYFIMTCSQLSPGLFISHYYYLLSNYYHLVSYYNHPVIHYHHLVSHYYHLVSHYKYLVSPLLISHSLYQYLIITLLVIIIILLVILIL